MAEALSLGMKQGTVVKVVSIGAGNEHHVDKVGKIEKVEPSGCTIRFDDSPSTMVFSTDSLRVLSNDEIRAHQKAVLAAKKKEENAVVELPIGVPYVLASNDQTSRCLLAWASSA